MKEWHSFTFWDAINGSALSGRFFSLFLLGWMNSLFRMMDKEMEKNAIRINNFCKLIKSVMDDFGICKQKLPFFRRFPHADTSWTNVKYCNWKEDHCEHPLHHKSEILFPIFSTEFQNLLYCGEACCS